MLPARRRHSLPVDWGGLEGVNEKETAMGRMEDFRQYAADCVRQAEGEQSAEDKNILLNMALAWVRLAQQSQFARSIGTDESGLSPALVLDAHEPPPAA